MMFGSSGTVSWRGQKPVEVQLKCSKKAKVFGWHFLVIFHLFCNRCCGGWLGIKTDSGRVKLYRCTMHHSCHVTFCFSIVMYQFRWEDAWPTGGRRAIIAVGCFVTTERLHNSIPTLNECWSAPSDTTINQSISTSLSCYEMDGCWLAKICLD